jgi:hypothetical protein
MRWNLPAFEQHNSSVQAQVKFRNPKNLFQPILETSTAVNRRKSSSVRAFGYSKVETLLITAPVWFATFLVSLFVTWNSG